MKGYINDIIQARVPENAFAAEAEQYPKKNNLPPGNESGNIQLPKNISLPT